MKSGSTVLPCRTYAEKTLKLVTLSLYRSLNDNSRLLQDLWYYCTRIYAEKTLKLADSFRIFGITRTEGEKLKLMTLSL